ncbi:MAG: hypothetical protein AAF384_12700 [Pseudomonadota bacterium]
MKRALVVLDFDGFLVNSYRLLASAFDELGLDVGDETRFKNRRKFLKYVGGGKEFLSNLATFSLPKKREVRKVLTEIYRSEGSIYPPFTTLMNEMLARPDLHVGIVSRNYTLEPGPTMRAVLSNSGIDQQALDFVIPVPAGAKKHDVLLAMRSSNFDISLFGGDEVGDFRAALATGYEALIASYGFDDRRRLIEHGHVPEENIFVSPDEVAQAFTKKLSERPRG